MNTATTVTAKQTGKVSLVGAGPGDPDLLTIKALKAIQSADLILFDYLVSSEIRALFPSNVPAFYVGKKKGAHSIAQGDLNNLLVKKAREGKNICRVKGGDPFVFGRGGEEALVLIDAGVEVEVVPGLTAASACSSNAGIPLTHRGLSQGCTLVTGHGEHDLNIKWQALAQLDHTLVFYMGLGNAPLIQQELMANGMAGNTPCAFIENGCRPEQRLVSGDLAHMSQLAIDLALQSPSLIIVGEVVRLAEQLGAQKLVAALGIEQHKMSA